MKLNGIGTSTTPLAIATQNGHPRKAKLPSAVKMEKPKT
jgi:hypothetical protein